MDLLGQGNALRLVSVHALKETVEKKTFFKNLKQYLNTPAKIIVTGDLNRILNAKYFSRDLRQDFSIGLLKKRLR